MRRRIGTLLIVALPVGDTLFTARIDATLPPPKVGDTVTLQLAREHMHWFDAGTTKRI